MKIKLLKYSIIFLSLFILHCASAEKSVSGNNSVLKGNSSKEAESADKIDNSKTFELFFTLDNDEDCISVGLNSEAYDEVLNKYIQLKNFYIVEKSIDISRFNSAKKSMFTEIGRNYDFNWNTRQKIEICSSGTDPIKTLNKNDNFRIRFTVFKDINFKYDIIISSGHKVKIMERNPVK
jgi:hypothetical protein